MRGSLAANFYSSSYNATVLESDTVFYRAGSADKELSQWFTTTPPSSVAQVRIDTTVKPQWVDPLTGQITGSSPIDTAFAVKIPTGTKIYQGPVGYQGGVYVGGPSISQTFIPAPWNINGVEVLK